MASAPTNAAIIADLNRAKAVFQLRAIYATIATLAVLLIGGAVAFVKRGR